MGKKLKKESSSEISEEERLNVLVEESDDMEFDLDYILENSSGKDKHSLAVKVAEQERKKKELIYHLVMVEKRIDILIKYCFPAPDNNPQPHHYEMMNWQDNHDRGLVLGFRGAAKTTTCTQARCIFELLHNPDQRILIACASTDQGKLMLRKIKSIYESKKFQDIFGDWVTNAKVWTETELTVNRRTASHGEPSILVAGVGIALPSRHFEVIICDDLVTIDNSNTPGQRDKIMNHYYSTLFPTLEQPFGKMWVIGTIWHAQDLHTHLIKNEFKDKHLVVSALNEDGESVWPEKMPTEMLLNMKESVPKAFWEQYMCRPRENDGDIFNPTHFRGYQGEIPDCWVWQGVDLAIGQKEHNDFFAHATIGICKQTGRLYLIDLRKEKLSFPQQVDFINTMYVDYPSTIRVIIEANAYQQAIHQQLKHQYHYIPVYKQFTQKDKITRAQQLAFTLMNNPLYYNVDSKEDKEVVDLLCSFPNVLGSKDIFDALDMAITRGLKGVKKGRTTPVGLI